MQRYGGKPPLTMKAFEALVDKGEPSHRPSWCCKGGIADCAGWPWNWWVQRARKEMQLPCLLGRPALGISAGRV